MRRRNDLERGFSLIEILAGMAIISLLAGLSYAGFSGAIERTRSVECAGKLRSIGVAMSLYVQENGGRYPRSAHSAAANRELGWTSAITPYLDQRVANSPASWKAIFNEYFRCPADSSDDPSEHSYGLNVHFELDPDGDDYPGSPASWHRIVQVSRPSRTILVAEPSIGSRADHFMAHQWSGVGASRNAIDHERHAARSNYLFGDGHVESLAVEQTFDPGEGINLWNPSLAK